GAGGEAAHPRRRPSGWILHSPLPQPDGPPARFHPGLRLRGRERPLHVPVARPRGPGIRGRLQEDRARPRGGLHRPGRLRRGARSIRELRRSRPRAQRPLGGSGPALPLPVRRHRAQDGGGHVRDGGRYARGGPIALTRFLVGSLSAPVMPPPPYLEIFREEVKVGRAGAHVQTEAGWPRAFAKAKIPNNYIAMTTIYGPTEAWFFEGHGSVA